MNRISKGKIVQKENHVYSAFLQAKPRIYKQTEYRVQLCSGEKITCGQEGDNKSIT